MLGAYIMELWFGKPIETYQRWGHVTTVDALQSWFDRERDELPIPLETAVSICLDKIRRSQDHAVAALLPDIVTVLAKTHEAWSST